MNNARRSTERGRTRTDWLDSYHSFSFGEYRDPAHMGYSLLRVINDDRIAPGGGFPTHPHREMEIITYPLAGALEHRDSTGAGGVIRPGDVQRMSAGRGISHSEFNPSDSEESHLLQIWLLPSRAGVAPDYAQRHFDAQSKRGQWRLLVSEDGREGSLSAHTDVALYAALLDGDETLEVALADDRVGYLHLARGELTAAGTELRAGDALKLTQGTSLTLHRARAAEVLFFDLPQ